MLLTNQLIQRDMIPKGWYRYGLWGMRQSPSVETALVDRTARCRTGTVLSPTLLRQKGTTLRRVSSAFHLLGKETTLE